MTLVMGVVNVTPDSFSDGGLYADAASAIAHGHRLLADGADILDVGGESTRPGATRPLVEEELDRVIPVVTALAESGARLSVDTMRHQVAAAALEAGATIVNDVSGGLADPEILRVVAEGGATYVAMHWRAHADHMTDFATYDGPGGVVAAVRDELAARAEAALTAGVAPDRLVLDPGLGFAKHGRHNWQLLADLAPIKALGHPLLVGASRKSFLGTLLADADGTPRPVDGRDDATTALSVVLAREGVWGLRVHDVRSTSDALRVLDALDAAREEGSRG
jgi:dihydropteroate synthase